MRRKRRREGGCDFVGKGLLPRRQARQGGLTRRREDAKGDVSSWERVYRQDAKRAKEDSREDAKGDAGSGGKGLPPRRKARQGGLTRRREGAKNAMAQ